MAEQIQQVKEVNSDGTSSVRTTQVVDDTRAATVGEDARPNTLNRIIWYIAGVIIALLAFRFVLVMLGANEGNGFVDFIYSISYPFAAPFFGMFGYDIEYGVSRVELSTLVAIAVYALVAYGLTRLSDILQRK